jgi:hypothetical protein
MFLSRLYFDRFYRRARLLGGITCGYLGVTSPLLSGRLSPEPRVQRKSGLATPYQAKISAKGRTQNTPTVTALSARRKAASPTDEE